MNTTRPDFLVIVLFSLCLLVTTISTTGCGGQSTGTSSSTLTTATADLCVEHASLTTHFHPFLSIVISGTVQTIPADTGVETSSNGSTVTCQHAIHTHDGTNSSSGFATLHVELPDTRAVTLKDFFAIWGKTYNQNQILDAVVDSTHEIVMTVDGEIRTDYENLVLADEQVIIITYQTKS